MFRKLLIISLLIAFSQAAFSRTDETSAPRSQVDSLLSFAFNYLGKPYRGGGSGPNSFDCSGFTGFVYGQFGYKLQRSSGAQIVHGIPVRKSDLQPGDLVFFKGRNARAARIGHVGIVSEINPDGSFQFIHAAVQTGVSNDNSAARYYAARYVTARRLICPETVINPDTAELFVEEESAGIILENQPDTIGQKLAQIPANPAKHTVEKGDTLFSLAIRYGSTVAQLMEWNGLPSASIRIGQELKVTP
ncbi:MAG: C40 family peptidase [Prevotellaceae bacterium]|jgi:LysM repeat protein|nr:C40 family peptidase [Prevotellaceae bacterium]